MADSEADIDTTSFVHLARPLGPATIGQQPSTAPLSVQMQPQALFAILDHSLRRPKDQDRVIGTLLGTRSEDGTEVTIANCYAVPHTETAEQVEVDMDYQKTMLNLHLRANPRETLVGWYATSADLNTFSALIQNFYGQQGDGTWPHPAVHLTLSTEPGLAPVARTYISAPIGVTSDRAAESCLFIPVPHTMLYGDAERSGLALISHAAGASADSLSATSAPGTTHPATDRTASTVTDIEALERTLTHTLAMIERVSAYVGAVLDEEAEGSPALGQFLLNALSLAPKADFEDLEKDFNAHVQDVLVISYLANTIRTQIELSNRLATAALTQGGGAAGGGGIAGSASAAAGGQGAGQDGAGQAVDGAGSRPQVQRTATGGASRK